MSAGDVRVYVAVTPDDLARLLSGELLAAGERFAAVDDSEEAEYGALMAAADASLRLQRGQGRRVVVVAELPDEDAAVHRRELVAVHMDTEERGTDADPDDDLSWFAPQELDLP